eukprot:TRINITY_DN4689_c0_g2_i1.p1 TRINITY_DN4689_c0_g2~~TRINITY_DN4689_c0_g2_i1.p1  ORF type:complete len:590 (+),score=97.37 TRINITY_DN4689_c0_g2_i1:287-2056(+)
MISNRTVATPPQGAATVNPDATYYDDSRLLFEECWIPSTDEYPQVSSFSNTNTTYYQPYYNGTFSTMSSETNQAVRVDQVFTTYVNAATPPLQQNNYSPTYRPQTFHNSPSPTPKISTPTNASPPIYVTTLPSPSPPPAPKLASSKATTVVRKEKKGNTKKKEIKLNGANLAGEVIQKKRKLKKKKTAKACVYCRHSHSCCDNFRPCSKCTARGIGHLCKESETSSVSSVNKIVKEMKRKRKSNHQHSETKYEPVLSPPKTAISPDSHSSSHSSASPIPQLISLPPPSPSIFGSDEVDCLSQIPIPIPNPLPIENLSMPEIASFPREILVTLNKARRPFPKDLCLAFHRLAKKSGWTSELISMWFKTEEFYRWKHSAEAAAAITNYGYREAVMKGACSILSTLDESSEPTLIWAEGLRLFAANTAALKFFGASFETMCNKAFGYQDDMEDYSGEEWNLESDILESENIVRLFDFIHKDDAVSFSCNAAMDAMSLYPLDFYSSKDDPPTQVARGFRTKVRLSLTKQSCNANIVPLIKNMANCSLADKKKSKKEMEDDYVVCLVTQSQYRDANKRFLFASCTFNRIDDLEE